MTLQELIIKLTDLTIDVKINKVEVEEGKIYLS